MCTAVTDAPTGRCPVRSVGSGMCACNIGSTVHAPCDRQVQPGGGVVPAPAAERNVTSIVELVEPTKPLAPRCTLSITRYVEAAFGTGKAPPALSYSLSMSFPFR